MNPPSPEKHCIAAALFLVAGLMVAESHAQEDEILGFELKPEEITASSASLTAALVGPRERAFGQVLTDARIERDQTLQGEISYDLIVQYDPGRYRDAHAGLYPLTFENQFILWGKRIALFTRSNRWRMGRFYLHDISSGDQAWIFANETKNLYPPPEMQITYPAVVDAKNTAAGFRPWLKLIHEVERGTDLRRMGRWFRLMRSETKDDVQRRAIEEQRKAATMEIQTP